MKGSVAVHYGYRDNSYVDDTTECELVCIEFGEGQVDIQADDVIAIYATFRPHSLIPSVSTDASYTSEPERSAYQPYSTPSGYLNSTDFNGAKPQIKANVKLYPEDDTNNPVPFQDYDNLIIAWVDPNSADGTVTLSLDIQTDDRTDYDDIENINKELRFINPYTINSNWRNIDTVVVGSSNYGAGEIGKYDNRYAATSDSKMYDYNSFELSVWGGTLDQTIINDYNTFKFSAGVHHILVPFSYTNNDSLDFYTFYDGGTYTDGTARQETGTAIITILVVDKDNLPASGVLNVSAERDNGWKTDLEIFEFGSIARSEFAKHTPIVVWGDEYYGFNDNYPSDLITYDDNGGAIVDGSSNIKHMPITAYKKFRGYITSRKEEMSAEGSTATYSCTDVLSYLSGLQGFGSAFISPDSDSAKYGLNFQVANNSVVKQAIIILSWYTNVTSIHPLNIDSNTIDIAQSETILQEGSILDQVRYTLSANDNALTSTRTGELVIHPDLLFVAGDGRSAIDRTATPTELHTDMVIDVKVNVLEYNPIAYVQYTGIVEGGVNAIRATYPNNSSIGEGTKVVKENDLVVFSQQELNEKVAIRGALETNQVYDADNEEMLPAVELEIRLFGGMDIFDRFNEYFVLSDAVQDAIVTPNGIDLSRYLFVINSISVEFEDGTSTVILNAKSAPFMIHAESMTTAIETNSISSFQDTYAGYDAATASLGSASLIDGLEPIPSDIEPAFINYGYSVFDGNITELAIMSSDTTNFYVYTTSNFSEFSSNIVWNQIDITADFDGEVPFKALRSPYVNSRLWILTNYGIWLLEITDFEEGFYTLDSIVTFANEEYYKNIAFHKQDPSIIFTQRHDGTNAKIGYLEYSSSTWSHTETSSYSITTALPFTAGLDSAYSNSDPHFALNRNVYVGDATNLSLSPTIDSNFSGLGTGLNYNAFTLIPTDEYNEVIIAVADSVTSQSTLYRRAYGGSNNVSKDITLSNHYVPTYLSNIGISPTQAQRFVVPFSRVSDDYTALYLTTNSGDTWKQITDYIAPSVFNAAMFGEVIGQFSNEVFAYGDSGTFKYSPNLGGTFTDKAIAIRASFPEVIDDTFLGFVAGN